MPGHGTVPAGLVDERGGGLERGRQAGRPPRPGADWRGAAARARRLLERRRARDALHARRARRAVAAQTRPADARLADDRRHAGGAAGERDQRAWPHPLLREGALARRRPRIQPVQVQLVPRQRRAPDLRHHQRPAAASHAGWEPTDGWRVSAGADVPVARRCHRQHAGHRRQPLRSPAEERQRARPLRLQPPREARRRSSGPRIRR